MKKCTLSTVGGKSNLGILNPFFDDCFVNVQVTYF